jgi:hypothetical protein
VPGSVTVDNPSLWITSRILCTTRHAAVRFPAVPVDKRA